MKKFIIIVSQLLAIITFTSCSYVTTTNVHVVDDFEDELVLEQIVNTVAQVDEIELGVVDTSDFALATTDEYGFKYNPDVWNVFYPYDFDEGELLLDTAVVLKNDVVEIIGATTTYLSNTTSQDYFELLIASIPSMPLTGVDILSTTFEQVGDFDVALIETKAGFTKDDIERLIYKQELTHENINTIGGLNYLDYKPLLSQFLLIVSDGEKAYTFVSSFENNVNSNYFNAYYRNLSLTALDSIVQTIYTNSKPNDK